MKKYKISNLIRGYQIETNYVMANNEDEAYEKYENDELLNDKWEITTDDMSIDDTEITEVA